MAKINKTSLPSGWFPPEEARKEMKLEEKESVVLSDKTECQCDGAGYCPLYGIRMNEKRYQKCKHSEVWRQNYLNFFTPFHSISKEQQEARMKKANRQTEIKEMRSSKQQLDKFMDEMAKEGVNTDNYNTKKEGLGDLVGNALSKVGVTEETIKKWAGIGGCGCDKRKKFLNKILPFTKKE